MSLLLFFALQMSISQAYLCAFLFFFSQWALSFDAFLQSLPIERMWLFHFMYESFPIYFEHLPSALVSCTILCMHLFFCVVRSPCKTFIERLLLLLLRFTFFFACSTSIFIFLFVCSFHHLAMSALILAGRFYSAVLPVIGALSLLSL